MFDISLSSKARLGSVWRFVCLASYCLAVGACSTLNTQVPAGFDLGGSWTIDALASDPPPDLKAMRLRADRDAVRDRSREASTAAAFVLHDFPVLGADALEIEQSADSMGVRYGETTYRDISWGERKRDFWTVQAGWEEGLLVVRSKRGGVSGTETLALEEGGQRLRIVVHIKAEGENVQAVRVFRRQ